MARKADTKRAGAKRARRKRPSSAAGTPEGAVFDAALGLAAERGWARLSLAEIAEAAGLKMSEFHGRYPTKQSILDGFARHVDRTVLLTVDDDPPEGAARERLFDLLMRRLDVLEANRDGVKALVRDGARDPLALVCGICALRRSMATMLEAAGLSAGGLIGLLRVKGLSVAYLAALRAWLGDESPDKAQTMAALDRALKRLDGWAAMLDRARRPSGNPQTA
jgi:AcrR family transcriptional regulator